MLSFVLSFERCEAEYDSPRASAGRGVGCRLGQQSKRHMCGKCQTNIGAGVLTRMLPLPAPLLPRSYTVFDPRTK